MLAYRMYPIPLVYFELKKAFNCSEKIDLFPRPDIYIKNGFPFKWLKYDWEEDIYIKKRRFRRSKYDEFDFEKNEINLKRAETFALSAELSHFLRVCETCGADPLSNVNYRKKFSEAVKKDSLTLPIENIIYEKAKPLVEFLSDTPLGLIPKRKNDEVKVNIEISEFIECLAQRFYDNNHHSYLDLRFDSYIKHIEEIGEDNVMPSVIKGFFLNAVEHLPYLAADKIKNVDKFLEENPNLIRKPKEGIIEDYSELFEDLFILD